MTSDNKTVNKAHEVIKARLEKLRDKRQNLRDRIDEKYPADACGMKGEMIFQRKSKKLDEEIKLLRQYDSGMYDLIELIERKEK